MKKRLVSSLLLVSILLVLSLAVFTPQTALAAPASQQQGTWCGNGSEASNYGFTYDLNQPHWTIGNGLVSETAMTNVDAILDKLNSDQLAQTMILVIPANQVGIPVNCAVHFLRYMKLGLPDGPHADNGFVFLFMVGDKTIEVHYGVGLGLPALTAQGLTPINRLAEDTYAKTGSVDEAVIETVKAYDAYVRSEYQVTAPAAPATTNNAPAAPTSNGNSNGLTILYVFLGIIAVGAIIFGVLWISGFFNSPTETDITTDYSFTPPGNTDDSSTTLNTSQDTTTYHRSEESEHEDRHETFTPTVHRSEPEHHYQAPSMPHYNPPPTPSRGGSGSGRSGRGG